MHIPAGHFKAEKCENMVQILNYLLFCSLFIILLILSTCDSADTNMHYEPVVFSQSDQQFSIVPFYLHMTTYVEKAKDNTQQIERIYKKHVYNPIWNDFASKGECSFLAKFLKKPITDLEGLETEIKLLSQSGVEDIVKEALLKISKVLPGPNTTIYLQVIDPIYKKYLPKSLHTGVVAHTFGSGRIFITIDPTTSDWRNNLRKIVAHEYHHSVWVFRNFKTINFSLLEYIILEGRADSFANLVYPKIKSPWTNIFGAEKEQRVWHFMKDVLHSRNEQLNMKMVVGDGDIPFASAYTIGYRIMQEFLKNNSHVTLLEWTDMEAEEILLKSKYEEKFY
jgi:uncharacterized protein YjaZ